MTLLKECVSIISLNLNQRFSTYPQSIENTYDRTLFCNCIINQNNNEKDDTGIGIHPQILPKLFTKFVSASPKGTGLGLYICKSIVEAHGGKIWAENDVNDNGATFMFSLPIDKDPL
jgi:light-regulated signal transduction histidine kinase (bacteriophytochrome)